MNLHCHKTPPLKRSDHNDKDIGCVIIQNNIEAYILTELFPGSTDKAMNKIQMIPCIKKCSVIAGDVDIIIRVQVKDLPRLNKITQRVQELPGVKKTTTHIIEREIS